MDRQLPRLDALLLDGFVNYPLGQNRRFPASDHPAHHVTAEDVQNHVEVKVGPLRWTQQLGDIPGPNLIRCRGQEFRFLVGRMSKLTTPFIACIWRKMASPLRIFISSKTIGST